MNIIFTQIVYCSIILAFKTKMTVVQFKELIGTTYTTPFNKKL